MKKNDLYSQSYSQLLVDFTFFDLALTLYISYQNVRIHVLGEALLF